MADELHSVTDQLGNEIIQWRQASLEEWYTGNIETMDQAVEVGRYILQMKEKIQIALGQLFNHVEKHKGGRGIEGGCRELGRRLGVPRMTYWGWMKATSTKKLAERSASLGTSKVALIEQAPEPELVWDEVDALENIPTVREIKRIIRKKTRESMPTVDSREEIKLGSIEDLLEYVRPASVDLILTDPPYSKEYLPLWSVLFEKALVCLKDGGLLVSYAPHIHLPEIFHRVPDGLDYVWMIAQIHAGGAATYHPSRVKIRWKPILVFVKGGFPDIDYYDDVLQGTGREKEGHEWQQALGESEEMIRRFTHEGDLVVDPFLGSGTVVVAAKMNNRNFFGMDIDRLSINTTLRRLEETRPDALRGVDP